MLQQLEKDKVPPAIKTEQLVLVWHPGCPYSRAGGFLLFDIVSCCMPFQTSPEGGDDPKSKGKSCAAPG